MRFFTLLLFVSLIGSLNAQEIIWGGPGDANSEFDGGLNDWTVNAVSPNENALWLWEEDARTELGAYHNDRPAISSPSAANGAMGFDSDYYDNDGTQGNFGNGLAASPQQGELVSPVIDCSGQPAVSVAWYQYFRQFQSTFQVQVTNDGGVTWVPFDILVNNDLPANSEGPVDQYVIIDISSVAANQSEVQFKFVYNADYYFWLIDDVSLVVTPANNLVANSAYLPPAAFAMPESMIKSDSLDFAVEIINIGSQDNMGGTVTAEILNAGGTAVHSFTEDLGTIPAGDTLFFIFDAQVFPEDIALTEGAYSIQYTIETIDEDFNESDNAIGINFVVTADVFDASTQVTNANAFTGEFKPGCVFRTGELAENLVYQVNNIMIGGFGDQDDPNTPEDEGVIQNAEASIYFFKVKNQLATEYDPIFDLPNSGIPGDEHDNLEYVGFGFFSESNVDNFSQNMVEVFNGEGTDVLQLEENTSYLVCLDWNDEQNNTAIFSNTSQQIFYYQLTNMVYIDQWFTLGSDPNNGQLAWALPINITTESIMSNNEVELDDQAVSVYPSPAVSFTAVELNFETPTNATIIMSDAKGTFITSKTVENATAEKVEFDLDNLPAGAYSFQIRTSDNAVATRSFVITK